MDGMGDDDRLGDDTPADDRHDSTDDGAWDDDDWDDDDGSEDEPFDVELLLLLERIDWDACDLEPDADADSRTEPHPSGIVDDPFETRSGSPTAAGRDHEPSACTAAMAEFLHPSACAASSPPAGGDVANRPSSGDYGGSRRQSCDGSGAIVPILCAVAGVFAMVAIVQLIPGEWPFWGGRSNGVAAQVTTSTVKPHPATFSLVHGDESKTAVLASPAGLLATISRLKPAQSVTVTHQLWVDTANLVAWDQASGVAVYEISSTHPMPTIPADLSVEADDNGEYQRSDDVPNDEIQVHCDEACPAIPGAPVRQDGTLVGLVALGEYESTTRQTIEGDRVVAIPLERVQEIADELVRASGG